MNHEPGVHRHRGPGIRAGGARARRVVYAVTVQAARRSARRLCTVCLTALLPAACTAATPHAPTPSGPSGLERLLDPLGAEQLSSPQPWPCVVYRLEPCPVRPGDSPDVHGLDRCAVMPVDACPPRIP